MSQTYSVVIPAYNAERTIAACLESVVSQTLPPLEVLVIDDASSDGTVEVLRGCEARFAASDIALRYFRFDQNRGPSAARNFGIRNARGSFIAFLDADDAWAREKLEIVDCFAADPNVGMICHAYTDRAGCIPPVTRIEFKAIPWSVYRMLIRNPAQTSCAVLSKSHGVPFDETMRYCEDHDVWMRVAERAAVFCLDGPPLTRLSRPQLSAGGLSENTLRMRIGQLQVYYNFCRRHWGERMWLLPLLFIYSMGKHGYSFIRRNLLP